MIKNDVSKKSYREKKKKTFKHLLLMIVVRANFKQPLIAHFTPYSVSLTKKNRKNCKNSQKLILCQKCTNQRDT